MQSACLRLCSAALAVFGILSPSALAQKSTPERYSAEPFVLEHADVVYAMNADGTGYMQKTVVAKIQSEAALQQLGILGMAFAANSQHVEFHYVRVRKPDGAVTETPLSNVIEQPLQATVQAPFYSDLKVAQVPVRNLQVGDTLEWEGRVVMTKAEAPNEFWGAENFVTEDAVVLEQSVELRAPATKNVTVWTNPALGIQPKESKDGDLKVYRWETQQLKASVGPEAEAAKEAKKKHILTAAEELDEERGKLPSVAWTTFPSWAAVGEWYRGLELSRATPDEEIKAKVAELTAVKTTDEDKVRAIYEYVSTQVRYIGVAFGVGRYQPHQAVDVLHNQYGDCKDKATLLTAMLAAAGFPSDAALIGAGVRFNEAVPSPGAFNHLITHLKLNGQDVWLDSTEEIAPYRMMYAVLRDREALVVPPAGTPAIEKTPKDPPFPSLQTWTAKGTLDTNGISDSQITLTERGDEEIAVRAAVRQLGPAQYDEAAQGMLGALGYSGKESHAEFSRPDEVNEPFRISVDYHREKAGDWDNLRTIPQLAPVSLPAVDEKDPPVQAIRLGTPRTELSTAEMKLPAGWTAELPEAVHEKSAYATYDLTYRFDKGTLYSERKIVVLKEKVPVSEWKTYKKFTDAISLGNETYVQLRRANGTYLASTPTVPSAAAGDATNTMTGADTKAAPEALLRQAATALQRLDLATAQSLLDQAKSINPKERHLWSEYGALALAYGKANEAIEDCKKELDLYPESYEAYAMVAGAQLMHHDNDAAKQTLRAWAKADSGNSKPVAQLGALEFSENSYGEAETDLQTALKLDPANERMQLLLGQAEMRRHEIDKGTATLKALLDQTSDPLMINDAVYELADAGQELALDESKEQAALDKLTKETESWTLDESPTLLKQQTSLLEASWDTMGWILYKEGKLPEARSYINAAWTNRQDPEVVKHHDALYPHPAEGQDAKRARSGKSKEVQIVKLSNQGLPVSTTTVAVTASAPQGLRTFQLGPANGRHGVAEYRLLLAHGRVERMEPIGEKSIEGAEAIVKQVDFAKLFPEGSEAKLVRSGMVNCYGDKCQLVLEP